MVEIYHSWPSILKAMVAKFSSISTRKLPKAISVLSHDKKMVATSDYGDFHKMVKRLVMLGMLGSSAQVQVLTLRKLYSLVATTCICLHIQLINVSWWNGCKMGRDNLGTQETRLWTTCKALSIRWWPTTHIVLWTSEKFSRTSCSACPWSR